MSLTKHYSTANATPDDVRQMVRKSNKLTSRCIELAKAVPLSQDFVTEVVCNQSISCIRVDGHQAAALITKDLESKTTKIDSLKEAWDAWSKMCQQEMIKNFGNCNDRAPVDVNDYPDPCFILDYRVQQSHSGSNCVILSSMISHISKGIAKFVRIGTSLALITANASNWYLVPCCSYGPDKGALWVDALNYCIDAMDINLKNGTRGKEFTHLFPNTRVVYLEMSVLKEGPSTSDIFKMAPATINFEPSGKLDINMHQRHAYAYVETIGEGVDSASLIIDPVGDTRVLVDNDKYYIKQKAGFFYLPDKLLAEQQKTVTLYLPVDNAQTTYNPVKVPASVAVLALGPTIMEYDTKKVQLDTDKFLSTRDTKGLKGIRGYFWFSCTHGSDLDYQKTRFEYKASATTLCKLDWTSEPKEYWDPKLDSQNDHSIICPFADSHMKLYKGDKQRKGMDAVYTAYTNRPHVLNNDKQSDQVLYLPYPMTLTEMPIASDNTSPAWSNDDSLDNPSDILDCFFDVDRTFGTIHMAACFNKIRSCKYKKTLDVLTKPDSGFHGIILQPTDKLSCLCGKTIYAIQGSHIVSYTNDYGWGCLWCVVSTESGLIDDQGILFCSCTKPVGFRSGKTGQNHWLLSDALSINGLCMSEYPTTSYVGTCKVTENRKVSKRFQDRAEYVHKALRVKLAKDPKACPDDIKALKNLLGILDTVCKTTREGPLTCRCGASLGPLSIYKSYIMCDLFFMASSESDMPDTMGITGKDWVECKNCHSTLGRAISGRIYLPSVTMLYKGNSLAGGYLTKYNSEVEVEIVVKPDVSPNLRIKNGSMGNIHNTLFQVSVGETLPLRKCDLSDEMELSTHIYAVCHEAAASITAGKGFKGLGSSNIMHCMCRSVLQDMKALSCKYFSSGLILFGSNTNPPPVTTVYDDGSVVCRCGAPVGFYYKGHTYYWGFAIRVGKRTIWEVSYDEVLDSCVSVLEIRVNQETLDKLVSLAKSLSVYYSSRQYTPNPIVTRTLSEMRGMLKMYEEGKKPPIIKPFDGNTVGHRLDKTLNGDVKIRLKRRERPFSAETYNKAREAAVRRLGGFSGGVDALVKEPFKQVNKSQGFKGAANFKESVVIMITKWYQSVRSREGYRSYSLSKLKWKDNRVKGDVILDMLDSVEEFPITEIARIMFEIDPVLVDEYYVSGAYLLSKTQDGFEGPLSIQSLVKKECKIWFERVRSRESLKSYKLDMLDFKISSVSGDVIAEVNNNTVDQWPISEIIMANIAQDSRLAEVVTIDGGCVALKGFSGIASIPADVSYEIRQWYNAHRHENLTDIDDSMIKVRGPAMTGRVVFRKRMGDNKSVSLVDIIEENAIEKPELLGKFTIDGKTLVRKQADMPVVGEGFKGVGSDKVKTIEGKVTLPSF